MTAVIASKPQLLDYLGRPIDMSALRRNVSEPTVAGVRSVVGGHPASNLDPRKLASILRAAETGDPLRYLELAEQMEEKDLHYLGVLGQRKRAVSQLEITVEAADDKDPDAQAAADLVRDWVARENIEDELFDQLDAIGKGFSLLEIGWDMSERQWWPAGLTWVDPRWVTFDQVTGRTPLLRDDSGFGQPLNPFKFVYTEIKAKSGLALRGGLARPVSWAWMFKNFTVKDWMAFAEVYGMPLRLGKYDANATPEERQILLRAVTNIGHDAAAIVPRSMDITFEGGKSAAGDATLFSGAADWFDRQISKAVLGQTMTTDAGAAGLGSNQADVQDGVRADIERADAKSIAAALNRDAVQPMIDLNLGTPKNGKYPRLVIGRAESWDVEKMMPAVKTFVDMKGRVGMSAIRDRLGIPDPGKDEELLQTAEPVSVRVSEDAGKGPQDPAKLPGAPEMPEKASTDFLRLLRGLNGAISIAANDREAIPDAVERYIGDNLSDWQELVVPAIAPVEQLLAGCSSYEEAQARLASVADKMGSGALVELIATAMFSSRLAGASGLTIADAAA